MAPASETYSGRFCGRICSVNGSDNAALREQHALRLDYWGQHELRQMNGGCTSSGMPNGNLGWAPNLKSIEVQVCERFPNGISRVYISRRELWRQAAGRRAAGWPDGSLMAGAGAALQVSLAGRLQRGILPGRPWRAGSRSVSGGRAAPLPDPWLAHPLARLTGIGELRRCCQRCRKGGRLLHRRGVGGWVPSRWAAWPGVGGGGGGV